MAIAGNEARPLCENDDGTVNRDVARALQQWAERLPSPAHSPFQQGLQI